MTAADRQKRNDDIAYALQQGRSVADIASKLKCSASTVVQVRKAENAARAREGMDLLPAAPDGRPRREFTAIEQAIRAEFAAGGISVTDMARKYGKIRQTMVYLLDKPPSVLYSPKVEE